MPVMTVNSQIAFVPLTMGVNDFSTYLMQGLKKYPTTFEVEVLGRELVTHDFETGRTKEFVRAVCRWGGYAGVGGKVLKHNRPEAIVEVFRTAHEASQNNDIREAMKLVLSIKCLAVSFASKHLKFLDPTKHVVLDSIISEHLGYARDVEGFGYEAFVADCTKILEVVKSENVPYPAQGRAAWRIADIEMAVFQKIITVRNG